jgi:predicted site-specific integrase-resolvase
MNIHSEELIDAIEVMHLLNISNSTLWRHIKSGKLPGPVYRDKKRYWFAEQLSGLKSCK